MSPRTLLQHVNYVGKLAQEADARIAKIIAKLEEAQRDPNQALPLRERRRIENLHKRKNVLSFARPKKKTVNDFKKTFLFESLQREFALAIFPIGGSILNTCLELYGGDILTAKQRNQLVGIGNKVITLAFDVLTGKKDLEQGLTDFVTVLKDLGNFFQKNPEVAIKIGATILASMHPLGIFIKQAVDEIFKESDMPYTLQSGLVGLLKNIATSFGKLEQQLDETAEYGLKSPRLK